MIKITNKIYSLILTKWDIEIWSHKATDNINQWLITLSGFHCTPNSTILPLSLHLNLILLTYILSHSVSFSHVWLFFLSSIFHIIFVHQSIQIANSSFFIPFSRIQFTSIFRNSDVVWHHQFVVGRGRLFRKI